MTALYADGSDLQNAKIGVQTNDLPPGKLNWYIEQASAWVEEFAQRRFDAQAGVVETLRSGGMGRAVISGTGPVLLYPMQSYPLQAITQIRWRTRGLPVANLSILGMSTSTSSWLVIDPSNYSIDPNWMGYGERISLFVNFSTFRHPSIYVDFEVTYSGGFTAAPPATPYPDWLLGGTLQYAAHLMKSRGASSLTLGGGTSPVEDPGMNGGHLAKARDYLRPHKRTF